MKPRRRGVQVSTVPLLYLLLVAIVAFVLLVAVHTIQATEPGGGLYDKLTKFVIAVTAVSKVSLEGGVFSSVVNEKYIRRDNDISNAVFFDWVHSSDFFGYANYKALESHLTHFDTASTKSIQAGAKVHNVYIFKVNRCFLHTLTVSTGLTGPSSPTLCQKTACTNTRCFHQSLFTSSLP